MDTTYSTICKTNSNVNTTMHRQRKTLEIEEEGAHNYMATNYLQVRLCGGTNLCAPPSGSAAYATAV